MVKQEEMSILTQDLFAMNRRKGMDRSEILTKAYIPESEWENCYVSENGQIYVPEDGLSGFEVYQRTMQALAQE